MCYGFMIRLAFVLLVFEVLYLMWSIRRFIQIAKLTGWFWPFSGAVDYYGTVLSRFIVMVLVA